MKSPLAGEAEGAPVPEGDADGLGVSPLIAPPPVAPGAVDGALEPPDAPGPLAPGPVVPGAPLELEPAAPAGLPLPAPCAQAKGAVASSATRPRETMPIAFFIWKNLLDCHAGAGRRPRPP